MNAFGYLRSIGGSGNVKTGAKSFIIVKLYREKKIYRLHSKVNSKGKEEKNEEKQT